MKKDPDGAKRHAYRTSRGGSWVAAPGVERVAYRGRTSPGYRYDTLGLRLVRTTEPVTTVGGFDEERS